MCEEDIVDWGPFMFEERGLRIYLPNSLRDHCHWHLQQLDNKLALLFITVQQYGKVFGLTWLVNAFTK